jgi:hypothetical protein
MASIHERLHPQIERPDLSLSTTKAVTPSTGTADPVRLVCPTCGTEAGCNCGVAPIDRAAYALLKHPEKSDRAIAAEAGVTHPTVAKARRATGKALPVEKRIGRDGRARRHPRAIESASPPTVNALAGHSARQQRRNPRSSYAWPQASAAMQALVGEHVNSARGERLRQVLLFADLLNVADAVSVSFAVAWPESMSVVEAQP